MIPDIVIGRRVCDKYTGSCGRVVSIINDEVEIEPTIIKRGARGEYLEVAEPPIRAKIANLEPDHIKRYKELPSNYELLINILEHEATGQGRIIDPAKARATPCTCFTYDTTQYAWSPGVLGLISEKRNPRQFREFCTLGCIPGGEGVQKRFEQIKGAISEAHERWQKKGGGLPAWWEEVAQSLEEHKIEL